MSDGKLKRKLTFIQMIAIASGAVIGGWLAEAPYWFSLTGARGALIFSGCVNSFVYSLFFAKSMKQSLQYLHRQKLHKNIYLLLSAGTLA